MVLEMRVCAIETTGDGRVEWHLQNWKRYMFTGQYAGLGHSGRASGGIGISHSADFDQLADQADRVLARTVDAIIRDLKPLEQKALRCRYLYEDWTDSREMALFVVLAKEGVRLGLNRKGVV